MASKLSSKIRFSIHNSTFFKECAYFFLRNTKNPEKRNKRKLRCLLNYKADYDNPRSFNEYLLWIKFNYSNDLWRKCADKLGCKGFLSEIGLDKYVPKTLGVYKNASDIDLDLLPEKFVLKTNHDSGSVYVCDKQKTDFNKVFSELESSLKKNYSNSNFEWFYDSIEPVIFAEELLESKSKDLKDYKFFVFSGKFKFGFVASDRRKDLRFELFEDDFQLVDCEYSHLKQPLKKQAKKPESFSKMVELAEDIGKHFDFVRVDLFDTVNGPMIGELTFCSQSGIGPFTKKEYDFKYGDYFKDTIFYNLAHNKKD